MLVHAGMRIEDRLLIFFFIPIVLLLLSPAVSSADADRIFKENSRAVVVVVAYDAKGAAISQGSGFIVRPDGAVVTNYHVISKAKDIRVKAGDRLLKVEGILHADKENDLVILKAEGGGLPTVKLGSISKAAVGEKVYVISSPQGLENTISDGILSGIREISPDRKILQVTAPVSSGSSGGPLFNKDGEVIGVVTFLIKEAQNLNFAMPVDMIKDKISAEKVAALKDYELEDYEKTAEFWFYLGYLYDESGRYQEAIEAYKKAISIRANVGAAPVYYNIGVIYDRLGRHDEAIEAYKQAIEGLKQVISIMPDYAPAHYMLGDAYYESGRYQEAIEAYRQAIRIKPDDAEAHISLGDAYARSGRYQEAVEAYKQAIRIKPDYAMAHIGLGGAYWKSGRYQEAIEAFKEAIRIKPDFAEIHFALGAVYSQSGRRQEAIEAFKQAIRIKPDFAMAHQNLGVLYDSSGRYQEAIEAYKQAIRIKSDDAIAHYGLGLTYLTINDRGSALEEYKILKALDRERANELFNLIYK